MSASSPRPRGRGVPRSRSPTRRTAAAACITDEPDGKDLFYLLAGATDRSARRGSSPCSTASPATRPGGAGCAAPRARSRRAASPRRPRPASGTTTGPAAGSRAWRSSSSTSTGRRATPPTSSSAAASRASRRARDARRARRPLAPGGAPRQARRARRLDRLDAGRGRHRRLAAEARDLRGGTRCASPSGHALRGIVHGSGRRPRLTLNPGAA